MNAVGDSSRRRSRSSFAVRSGSASSHATTRAQTASNGSGRVRQSRAGFGSLRCVGRGCRGEILVSPELLGPETGERGGDGPLGRRDGRARWLAERARPAGPIKGGAAVRSPRAKRTLQVQSNGLLRQAHLPAPGLPARVDGHGRSRAGEGPGVAAAITRDRLVGHCALFDAWIE